MMRKRIGRMVALVALTASTTLAGGVTEPSEDHPDFDCRVHGNRTCGVEVGGDWYLVTFDEVGAPAEITERGW